MARNSNASYESGDNRRVPLSGIDTSLSGKYFATLDEFVRATNSIALQRNRGYSFHFYDTGGWCPLGTVNRWYRCMIVRYQNPIGTAYSVGGTVLLAADGYTLYYGYINGTTSFTVEWTSIKDDGTIRAALPRTAGMLNGHFVAGSSGWTAIGAHENGNISKQYRVQLQNNGSLQFYSTTDGGATWTYGGIYVKTDQVGAWTNRTITPITSYINNGGHANCYYNETLKLATFSFNCNISATVPSGGIIMTGLPKSVAYRATFCVGTATNNANARLFVNRDGQVVADGAVSTVAWYSGSVTYPYSSL